MAQRTKKEIVDWIHENPNYHGTRLEDAKLEISIDMRDILQKINVNLDTISNTLWTKMGM